MNQHRLAPALFASVAVLAGCKLPGTYATVLPDKEDDFDRGGYSSFLTTSVKPGFINVVREICSLERLGPDEQGPTPSSSKLCADKTPSTDYACWADTHRKAKSCLDAVTLHAVDQCSILVGRQNRFAANFTRWLFPIQALLSVTADAAAVSAASASGNTSTTALTAVALSNSADLQKTAPSTQVLKVADFVANATNYILISNFRDGDVDEIRAQNQPGSPRWSTVKFSRFHDAILGSCPAYNP